MSSAHDIPYRDVVAHETAPLHAQWMFRAASRKMSPEFDMVENTFTTLEVPSNLTNTTTLPQTRLVQVAANVPGAMELCIKEYGSLVWNLVKRHVSSHSSAEDIVQEVFTEIWKSAARFDPGKGNEVTFIATIARRRAIDWVRRQSTTLTTVALPEHFDQLMIAKEPEHDPRSDHEEVATLVQTLPEQTRTLFELHFERGFTQEEIALQTAMPLGTVKTLLRRGLLDIRSRLSRLSSSSFTASRR
jgi:RNA polymerase sigma-70 factor (ECF subfamily)